MRHRFEREELQKWTSLQRTAYMLLPLIIYLAVHDMVQIILGMIIGRTLTETAYTLRGVASGLAILIALFSIMPVWKNEIFYKPQDENEKKDSSIKEYAIMCLQAFCTAVGINILFYQLGFTQSSENFRQVQEAQYGIPFFVGLVLYGIISPIAEEAVFRGILYNRLKRCFSMRLALILSAVLFGCYHGNLVQAFYGIILGLFIAWVYEKYHSFMAPVLFHSVANIGVYVLTYYGSLNELSREMALAVAGGMLLLALAGLYRQLSNKEK